MRKKRRHSKAEVSTEKSEQLQGTKSEERPSTLKLGSIRVATGGQSSGIGDLPPADSLSFAISQHRAGNLSLARDVYEKILSTDPANPNALHFMGLLLHDLGDSEEAIRLIAGSLDIFPNNPSALNNLGNVLKKQSRMAEAVDAYRKCLALAPRSAGTLSNLGIALKVLGKFEEAVECFRKAIEIDPKHSGAHHNLGNVLMRLDRHEEAIAAYRHAVGIFPCLEAGRHRLGAVLAGLGRLDEAAKVYKEWLEVEPDNALAKHMLAGCSGVDVPSRAADETVQQMFDDFSERFDVVLERLGYRAPALIEQAIIDCLGDPHGDRVVLDAGCGTGLCGQSLKRYARRLVGVDLSSGMVEKARARGIYDELAVAELTEHLRSCRGQYDVVASADTLCYFGDLVDVLSAASEALRPGGVLVFTLESTSPGDASLDFCLRPHGRYAHTDAYVRALMGNTVLQICAFAAVQLRFEMLKPVEGWLVTAQKP